MHGHNNEIPEWKKKVMYADPNTAPFGGNWNIESSMDAIASTAASTKKMVIPTNTAIVAMQK